MATISIYQAEDNRYYQVSVDIVTSVLDRTYGSGSLSYDPDWSFLLEREKDTNGIYTDYCNMIITKLRQGGLKDAGQRLRYDKVKQMFFEVAKDTYPRIGE